MITEKKLSKSEIEQKKNLEMWNTNPIPACKYPLAKCGCKAWMDGHYICIAKYVNEKREC